MAFGSIISSTDPVCILAAFDSYKTDPAMYNIIFGESIFNDAVSFVGYEIVKHYKSDTFGVGNFFETIGKIIFGLFVSSIFGFFLGWITALSIKHLKKCFKHGMEYIEIAILIALPWLSYLAAHLLGLSGILCIFFNGLAQKIYTKPLLTKISMIVKSKYLLLVFKNDLSLYS